LKTFKNIPHLVERRKVRSLKMKICHRFTTHAQHKNTKQNRVRRTTGGFIVYAQRRIMLHPAAHRHLQKLEFNNRSLAGRTTQKVGGGLAGL
jgi:hypothetical protein